MASSDAVEIGTLAVEHVHEEHTRETSFLGTVPVPGRLHLDAHDGAQDEYRPFDDAQRGDRIALEAGVAGRVDQVDLPALPFEVLDGRRKTSGAAARPRPSR